MSANEQILPAVDDRGDSPRHGNVLFPRPEGESAALKDMAPDIAALRAAIADTASSGATLWLSYMFLLFYLLIAVGSVDQRALLLETPVKLPFMDVNLPLKGFFWLGPLMFLLVHGYVLVHFVFLAQKIYHFEDALKQQCGNKPDPDGEVLWQLPGLVFVQLLAAPPQTRRGFMRAVLWVIAIGSLVIGPLCLLLFFQLAFLAYHHEVITWWQRSIAGLDLVMLAYCWGTIAIAARPRLSWFHHGLATATLSVLTVVVATVLLLFATFPGEWLEYYVWNHKAGEATRLQRALTPIRKQIVAGTVDPTTRRTTSFFANRIVAPALYVHGAGLVRGTGYVREAGEGPAPRAGEQTTPTVSLRGRNLRSAVLIAAVLEELDFTAADLQGAHLENARLRKAHMGCADPMGETGEKSDTADRQPECTILQDAKLDNAQLQGVLLAGAKLQRASFIHAQMQAADLSKADLTEVILKSADLQAADLHGSVLLGSNLENADLEAANLDHADLKGSALTNAILLGASLNGADVRSTQMNGARVPGVSAQDVRLDDKPVSPQANPSQPLSGQNVTEELRKIRDEQGANPTAYDEQRARYWKQTGCTGDGGPLVVQRMTDWLAGPEESQDGTTNDSSAYMPFGSDSSFRTNIAQGFLAADCAGARNLDAKEKMLLEGWAAAARSLPTSSPARQ